jgi:hypothetical protein
MFNSLVRELLLRRPEDPIAYLIAFLQGNSQKVVVCLQGYEDERRQRLAKIVGSKLGFKVMELSEMYHGADYHLLNDDKVNKRVLEGLKDCEKMEKGVIVSGYPNNLQQV